MPLLHAVCGLSIPTGAITADIVLALHRKAFGPLFDWAGKFRTVDVRYGGKDAPHFYEVPALVKQFCDDLEERFKHLPELAPHS